jgi:hypothetical protein
MGIHGRCRDEELLGDVTVCLAGGDQCEDLQSRGLSWCSRLAVRCLFALIR